MAEIGIGQGAIRIRVNCGGRGKLDDLDRCRSETQRHEPAGTSLLALPCVDFLLADAPAEGTHLLTKNIHAGSCASAPPDA